jgi:RNA polymerase sigma-70 factor (ECF subfamily)
VVPFDAAAWQQFLVRYEPIVRGFCLQWHLQPSDADDVTQNVLLRLVHKLREFRYDPARSFRAWLKTLTRHALSDWLAEQRRELAAEFGLAALENEAAGIELANRLEAEFDRELLEEALRRVRVQVSAKQWDAFRLTALEGQTGATTAAQLGMQVASVFTAKSKVRALLRAELDRLEVDPR